MALSSPLAVFIRSSLCVLMEWKGSTVEQSWKVVGLQGHVGSRVFSVPYLWRAWLTSMTPPQSPPAPAWLPCCEDSFAHHPPCLTDPSLWGPLLVLPAVLPWEFVCTQLSLHLTPRDSDITKLRIQLKQATLVNESLDGDSKLVLRKPGSWSAPWLIEGLAGGFKLILWTVFLESGKPPSFLFIIGMDLWFLLKSGDFLPDRLVSQVRQDSASHGCRGLKHQSVMFRVLSEYK